MSQMFAQAKAELSSAAEGSVRALDVTRYGAMPTQDDLERLFASGYGFFANVGTDTTPATFAGAYDADGPDLYIYVPEGTCIIPVYLNVVFEAVGTESTMEIVALYSNNGDSTATGTAITPQNARTDAPRASGCTVTGAVDAAGITDPEAAGNRFARFWHFQRPLTDTVATGENDRLPLVFEWKRKEVGAGPVIVGNTPNGAASLVVHAASQAGTGFITAAWVEIPASWVV